MDTCDQAPLRLPKMQDHQLLTLDGRSFSGWGRERLSTCLLYKGCQYIRKWQCSTIVNILQLTVGYLNATINRKNRNAELEIGPVGSSQTGQNPQVDGYGAGLGLPRSSGWGFWTGLEPNRTVFPVQTWTTCGLPGPIANTRDNPYQQPYNLSRSASKQRVHCGSLWHLSLHCAWPSASWKSIDNEKFLPHSGFTENLSVSSPYTICPAPMAYQASYQAHPPAPLPKGTRNAFPALDGE